MSMQATQRHLQCHMLDQYRNLTLVIIFLKYILWRILQKKKRTRTLRIGKTFRKLNSDRHKDSIQPFSFRMILTLIIRVRMSQSMQLGVSAIFQTAKKESMEGLPALQTLLAHRTYDAIRNTVASQLVASQKVQKLSKPFSSTCSRNIIKLRSTSSPKTSLTFPYHLYLRSNLCKVKLQDNRPQCFHKTLVKNQDSINHICSSIYRIPKCKYLTRCNGLRSIQIKCHNGNPIRLLCRHLICIWHKTCHHPKWDTTDLRCTTAIINS